MRKLSRSPPTCCDVLLYPSSVNQSTHSSVRDVRPETTDSARTVGIAPGPTGTFDNGNIGTLTRLVPADRVVGAALCALPARARRVRGARALAGDVPARLLGLGRHRHHRLPPVVRLRLKPRLKVRGPWFDCDRDVTEQAVLLARSVATMLPRLGSTRGDSRGLEGTTVGLEREDRQRLSARSPLPSFT